VYTNNLGLFLRACEVLVIALMASAARAAIVYTPLVIFDGTNGANPVGALVQGRDGELYGTAPSGGVDNATGTVFRLSLDGSQFTNLYFFSGGADGVFPSAGLAAGANGAFYGTARGGGVSNYGTVYRITTDGTLTTLASFVYTNGANPDTTLTPVGDGSFYGGTAYGGAYTNASLGGGNGYGVLFRVTTNGDLSVPVFFDRVHGSNPGPLIHAADGSFYGATAWGGNTSFFVQGFGTLFRITSGQTMTNIYLFSGFSDGGFPYAGLCQGVDGLLYGAAYSGGSAGYGTLFAVTTNGQYLPLHSFSGGVDGANPAGGMVQAADANFYGTTSQGASGYGSVFQVTPGGEGTTLVSFTGPGGSFPGGHPQTPLLLASDGNFYGVTPNGGTYNLGVLFRLSVPLPSVLKSVLLTNATLYSTWTAVAGQSYEVQYTTDLAGTNWLNLSGRFTATDGTLSFSDSIGTDEQRFYRVTLLP
jgi:uncharacterized repeat protein (TIGR03803 family)